METGKTGKYIKYALGEIVLVVIGILIALSINNWNQLKQHKSELFNHLNTVVENIIDDKTKIISLIEFRKNGVTTSKDILHKYENTSIDNSTELIDAMMNIIVEKRFIRHTSGFERLEKAELYQSENLLELRELIAEYDKIIEEIIFWEIRFNSFTESMENELYNNGFFHQTLPSWLNYKKSKPEYKEINDYDIQSIMDKYHSISSLFFRSVFTSHDAIDKYKKLVAKGEEIENEIEIYLLNN